jgi:hypothetical protein
MFRASSAHLQEVNDVIAEDGHLQRKTIPMAAYIYNLHHWPPKDELMTLETCRGIWFYVIYKIVYHVGINKRTIFNVAPCMLPNLVYKPTHALFTHSVNSAWVGLYNKLWLHVSWPAGHICPTYKEYFQVRWDNSIPLFLHAAIYLEEFLFRWTSQNAFSCETAVYKWYCVQCCRHISR